MAEGGDGYVLQPEALQGPLTARNLEDFALCPRKYLLSHFVPRGEARAFVGGPAALHRAVRAALMEAYAAGGPKAFGPDRLRAAFARNWDGSCCRDSLEEEQLQRDGLRMLDQHLQEPVVGEDLRVDMRLEAELDGQRFVAVADLLGSKPAQVVRFSTARRPPSPGQLREDLSWGLLWLVGREALGGDSLTGVLWDLRNARRVEYALDAATREELIRRLTAGARAIRGEHEFETRKGQHCRWCRSRLQCPAWGRAR